LAPGLVPSCRLPGWCGSRASRRPEGLRKTRERTFRICGLGPELTEAVSKLEQARPCRTICTSSRSCTGDFPVYRGLQEIKLLHGAARSRFDTGSTRSGPSPITFPLDSAFHKGRFANYAQRTKLASWNVTRAVWASRCLPVREIAAIVAYLRGTARAGQMNSETRKDEEPVLDRPWCSS
jgi:hypothetical protein